MFVKISKVSGVEYVTLVESKWDKVKKKAVHKVVQRLGRKEDLIANDPLAIEKLKEECKKSKAKISEANQLVTDVMDSLLHNVLLTDNETLDTMCYGNLIYRKLFKTLKLDKFFNKVDKSYRTKYSLSELTEFLVTSRILRPESKLQTFNQKEKFITNYDFSLESVYRSLEKIGKEKSKVVSYLNKQLSSLYNRDLTHCYYDVTTIYFESFDADELRNFGFSKDLKVNQTQVVLALAIDNKGIPITYEVFPGNTNEFKTFLPFLESLKNNFGFQNITIIADKGLNSKNNLLEMKKLGYNYIITEKIKSLDKKVSDAFDLDTFESVTDKFFVRKIPVIDYVNSDEKVYALDDELVLTYSSERSKYDLYHIEKLKQKATKLIEQKNHTTYKSSINTGGKKYISSKVENVEFNQKQYDKDLKTIGFYGIRTNIKEIDPMKIYKQLRGLWKIEESFRVLKTNFEARPVYVWKKESILGHFLICYISLVIQRYLELLLKETVNFEKDDQYLTTSKIIKTLNEKATVVIWGEDKEHFLRLKMDEGLTRILKAFNINSLPKYGKVENLSSIILGKR
ncbi:IS1634 family transposase [Mycoplasma sp. NEAQ87857]|uniref:IS1634 family transposase n=1 Tax=Mycoplasma sp. NEAQ87857 TaxID=2683967 RepID=UPI001316F7D5|nr:IS1634 family transposase [Mycoplasma sp. NEAQ87857]QGZ97643.1 IS1634 family transposase [Mycoplasma sp. NEAQ87857]QGZ97648.1 IS1634 family transposase [Mycoplasma sp. NEAQ87857]QGZ97758.1 IS1634 family transposase [Mycoplasma sp. NEAQ87857]QGZ97759.1 IS1634 family transposase [Mycoplasma sp. NEAQ87857]QGZ97980.1 IS1634 family transposase [Mycoplasma sp. NEAQ87857]